MSSCDVQSALLGWCFSKACPLFPCPLCLLAPWAAEMLSVLFLQLLYDLSEIRKYLGLKGLWILPTSFSCLCLQNKATWLVLFYSIVESLLTMGFHRNKIPKDLNQLRPNCLWNCSVKSAPELYHPQLLLLDPFKNMSGGEVALWCILP